MPISAFSGNFGLNPGSTVIPGTVQAITSGNDLYLRGQKILIGLNRYGVCGGETAVFGLSPSVALSAQTPAWVYNPNGLSSTSTNPDYTFPGTPEDGFVLGVNGGTNIHNTRGTPALTMSGTVTNLSSGRTLRGRWVGSYQSGNINLSLTNLYEFDVLGDYVKFTYTISNLSTTDLTNVVFVRSFDPDPEAGLGGTYNTFNGTNNTSGIRMAYGKTPGITLLNGAVIPTMYIASYDTAAQAGRGGFTINNAYSPGFSYTNNVGTETSVDEAIGMVTTIGTIPAGGSFSRYMYIGFWNSTSMPPNPNLPG